MLQESPLDGSSISCCHLYLSKGEEFLFEASGFFYEHNGNHYLVTNWHVLSNRNFTTTEFEKETDQRPDRVLIQFRQIQSESECTDVEQELSLDGWLEHKDLEFDIACLKLPDIGSRPINSANLHDMALGVADELFVLGFPGGWNATTANTPFWRHATCASDPGVGIRIRGTQPTLDAFYIDSSSDSGMSGAPVLLFRYVIEQSGGTFTFARRRQFVGVFSSTLDKSDNSIRDLGVVWKPRTIEHVIENGTPHESVE